jgi:hypothetical protein
LTKSDTFEDHIDKANHDLKVSDYLSKKEEFCDWNIISIFYYAVHCIEAYAHKINRVRDLIPPMGRERERHRFRLIFVQKNITKYYGLYDRLYKMSRKCRYHPAYYKILQGRKGYYIKLLQESRIGFTDIIKGIK